MKVLWFSNTPANSSPNGVAGGWLESLDVALQEKVDLHVAYYDNSKTGTFKVLNTTYHPLAIKSNKFSRIKQILQSKIVEGEDLELYISLVHAVQPDIIHIHGTENPFGCLLGKVKVPIVISLQGIITVYSHKFFSGIESQYFWKVLLKPLPILERITWFGSRKLFNKMASREVRSLMKVKYLMGRTTWDRRVSSVLASSATYFHSDELLRPQFYQAVWQRVPHDGVIKIFSTTSNSPYKGFETMAHALRILEMRGVAVKWCIAGLTKGDMIVQISSLKLKLNYPEKDFIFLGRLPANKLIDEMLSANIYVSASHIENSPNNLCEAMTMGMPCITTFAGGTGSLLTDGVDGVMVQPGDPWALAGAIYELAGDERLAAELGAKARLRALARHDQDRITRELVANYQYIINDDNKLATELSGQA